MFADTLTLELNLVVQNDSYSAKGSSIKSFRAQLHPWGFSGEVEFLVSCETTADPLLDLFLRPDPMETRLSLRGVHNLPDPPPPPLVVTGLVTHKAVTETTYRDLKGNPILHRIYTVRFEDYAGLLWRQHFPTQLAADATMGEVVKQQVVEGISLEQDWNRLKSEQPMICLGLGETRTSFFDFLMWYVDRFDGVFLHDYDESCYRLSAAKDTGAKPAMVRGAEVEKIRVRLPETARASGRVLNASTEASKTVAVPRKSGVDGVFRDVLIRTPVASAIDDRKGLESGRLKTPEPELEVTFKQYPTVPFWPGTLLKLQPEDFNSKLLAIGKTFRCYQLSLAGKESGSELQGLVNQPFSVYDVELDTLWERDDDPVVKLPPYSDPSYPIYVEGKIVCEMGEDGDRCYMVYCDEKTSQYYYKVQIPLWNKQIMVGFAPHFVPGHFYIPAYKDARVLLALYFDRAEIIRFIDWGADVQLPAESQGNHILFGKNKTSETSAQHVYVDSKPVFSIRRICDGDIELVQIEDGTILLETKEDQSLKQGEPKFDLTPKVAAARAKLSMATKSSLAQISGGYEQASAALKAEINGAVGQTKAALEGMEDEISGKVEQVSGEIEAAVAQLSEKAAALQGAAEEAKAELKKKLKL